MWRNKMKGLGKNIQGIHFLFCSFSTYIKHFPCVFRNPHFIHYKGCIFITVVLITFQNDHCRDYLQIISCNRIAHFKRFLATDSIYQCSQGCGDRAIGYKGASQTGTAVGGPGLLWGATHGKRWTREAMGSE